MKHQPLLLKNIDKMSMLFNKKTRDIFMEIRKVGIAGRGPYGREHVADIR